jgi:hypothetical protein
MARPEKGPRLYLRRRGGKASWVIRHHSRMIATGCPEEELPTAEDILDAYCYAGNYVSGGVQIPEVLKPRMGWVYFVSCDQPAFPIKIGWATSIRSRLQSLQCSLPYRICLLASFQGTPEDERSLHIGYREWRLQGEWFTRNTKLMALIERNAIKEAA